MGVGVLPEEPEEEEDDEEAQEDEEEEIPEFLEGENFEVFD